MVVGEVPRPDEQTMHYEKLEWDALNWKELDSFPDRTIHQTRPWLSFLAATQQATPVVAILREGQEALGFFTGAIVRKFGLPILGSPFRGWTTSYMGFNLRPDVCRADALRALVDFAFKELRCVHLELMDRRLAADVPQSQGFDFSTFNGYEIDLTKTEDELLRGMDPDRKRYIRKAEKDGVKIEEASDLGFADDYYSQLQDVFAKQRLVPTYCKDRVLALIQHVFPSGNLLLLRARNPEGRCIATGIFPAMNDTAYFWGAASYRPDQRWHPNEAIQWYAIRYWKKRGMSRYDMGGGGSYKEKYGGQRIAVPWVRMSRYKFLAPARTAVRKVFRLSQRIRGCFQSPHPPP